LDGGVGADMLIGGNGDDTYVIDNTGDLVTELANEGADTVRSAVTLTLGAHLENLTLTGGATINGTGNELDNLLSGNSATNVLDGGDGADILTGGTGADSLTGSSGDDRFQLSTDAVWTSGFVVKNVGQRTEGRSRERYLCDRRRRYRYRSGGGRDRYGQELGKLYAQRQCGEPNVDRSCSYQRHRQRAQQYSNWQ
jgi:RTX calcium-binding nonapeptide repeat (4 copies)